MTPRRFTPLLAIALAGATFSASTGPSAEAPGSATDGGRAALLVPGGESTLRATGVAASLSDSARAEFQAGRYWHAARLLHADGAARRGPGDVLLLARAEAGWNNWPAVKRLLTDARWLETEGAGAGLYLLGRAEEEAENWTAAARAFERFVAVAPPASVRHRAALVRAARSSWRGGDREGAIALLDRPTVSSAARSWLALELASDEVEAGNVRAVETLLARIDDARALDAAWRMRADVLIAAGDSAAATDVLRVLRGGLEGDRRLIATVELGRLVLAAGDTAEARALLTEGAEGGPLSSQARAAGPLTDLGGQDREETLRLSRILDRSGDGRRALRGYDRVMVQARADGVAAPIWMRIERARLMGTVRSRQEDALEEFRAIREETDDEVLGPRNLEVWTQLRRRQGNDAHVSTLRRWLVDEYPGSPQAAELVFERGNQAELRGQLDAALREYAFVATNARTHARAGEARMRSGQIQISRSDRRAAVDVYEAYLDDFPDGRRWTEAAYWAARVRWQLGDTAAARAHVNRILRDEPVSYYAVMGADLIGTRYDLVVPEAEATPAPAWLTEGLSRLDLFTEAGLDRAASDEIAGLRSRARASKADVLNLAEALNERGRTIDGINLAWELREDGHAWDSRLIRVAYPFPYRELVRREAAEWGVDPITMAAIIRQESAFKADIVSHAGAVGLMQVMPPTGAQLARTHGPDGFHEANLTAPEVNLHLGAAFFVEMSARYDGDLPLVLSAYNAGPTRANRWRRYPEVSDPLRFTERIPFVETRGYVKNVRRNQGLYRVLYGHVLVGDQD